MTFDTTYGYHCCNDASQDIIPYIANRSKYRSQLSLLQHGIAFAYTRQLVTIPHAVIAVATESFDKMQEIKTESQYRTQLSLLQQLMRQTLLRRATSQYRTQLSLLQQHPLKTLAQSGFPSPIWQTK